MSHKTITESWFGPSFDQLHPDLQAIHRFGGKLSGKVSLHYGKGIAGFLGKRIAKRMGVAALKSPSDFEVFIEHNQYAMTWRRIFDSTAVCESMFVPVGEFPAGYWIEKTGAVSVELGVRVEYGAWHWDCRRVLLHGVALPGFMRPVVKAHKRIEGGKYCFSVEFSHPWLGVLFGYEGVTALRLN